MNDNAGLRRHSYHGRCFFCLKLCELHQVSVMLLVNLFTENEHLCSVHQLHITQPLQHISLVSILTTYTVN